MSIQEYLESLEKFQKLLLDLIDNEENIEEKYQNLVKIIKNTKTFQNPYLRRNILFSIIKIANSHYRLPNFFQKINRILLLFKDEIKQKYSNLQIFKIFKQNKRLILFLIEEKILELDENIVSLMKSDKKLQNFNYVSYLFNEVKPYLKNKTLQKKIEKILNDVESNNYDKLRENGENEETICKLIREDNIDDFITFFCQNDLTVSTQINPSIFETNLFLIINNEISLIEYAAFYGSIQIFKYLFLNNQHLASTSLWLFAIHGNNPEIINFLEEKNLKPENEKLYQELLNESIKCHHFEITEYIKNNYGYLNNNDDYSTCFKYYNFAFFPENLNNESSFFYLCKYNYLPLIEILIKNKDLNINAKIIQKIIYKVSIKFYL